MTRAAPQWLGTSDRHVRLRRIESLDPETDYREITQLFYGDFQSAMFMKGVHGFIFTYAAPRISKVLAGTGELQHRIARRVVDTSLLASAVMQHGFKAPEGRDAARRVNAMHARYDIDPTDFVAVGAEEALGSLDLAERFGWRPVTDREREALRIFYSHQARAFGSPRALPGSVPEMRAFFEHYLDTELRHTPQNERLARALLDWYGGLVPAPFRPLFRTLLVADLDPRIAASCGLRQPGWPARRLMDVLLRRIAARDPVPDGVPSKLQKMAREVYPDGWTTRDLGTHAGADRPLPEDAAVTA